MKRFAALLCLAICALSAHSGSGKANIIARVGNWTVLRYPYHGCMAVATKKAGPEMLTLEWHEHGIELILINGKMRMQAGNYPVRLSMNGYSVMTTGEVNSRFPSTIAVTLIKSEFTAAFQDTTWITVDLDGDQHTQDVDGSGVLGALMICEKLSDPGR
jgi:hypothetical protein